ncbi:MAG: hemolysin family protein, partial [Microbacterium sp.]|nr:hemolysin family protein [Microbacterium sp.]
MSWWFTAAALLLFAVGGLMAALDAALGAMSRIELAELAQRSRSRRSIEGILADVGAHQNAANFLRVVAEMTGAVLVTLAFATWLDPWGWVLLCSALILIGVSFVLVGSSPRSVGRVHAAVLLSGFGWLVRGARVVLGPIANALVAIGDRVTPGRPAIASFSSEEQLLHLVDEATERDVLEEVDRELIHSIFEFSDALVREVMVPRTDMITIDGDKTVAQAIRVFLDRGVSRMPVVGDGADEILGMLYLRDVVRYREEHPGTKATVVSIARPAVFVPESKKADATLRELQREATHIAMVVDEYGGIAGLVTMEDLIEELVGEISDEYDRDLPGVEPLDADGHRFRVAARLPADELGDLFGIELDDEDVDSVGGLLAKAIGRVPVRGSSTEIEGVRLTAERLERR